MMCIIKRTLMITSMTLTSKVNLNISYSCMVLIVVLHILYNNCQYNILAKDKDQNNLILVALLVKQIFLTCFVVHVDGSYFAHGLPNVCICQL